MDDWTIPASSRDLIELLDKQFSYQRLFPKPGDTPEQIHFKMGQRELVDILKRKLAKQEQNLLNMKGT